jgi:hypothetical protein
MERDDSIDTVNLHCCDEPSVVKHHEGTRFANQWSPWWSTPQA